MVTLRSQKRARSRGSITALKTTKNSQSQRSASTGSTIDVDGREVESFVSSPVSVMTRSRSQTSLQEETERCRRRVRFGTNRDNTLKNAATGQRRQHQIQSVGSAVLEIEQVQSPFSLQWISRASSHDYVSRCAVNRAARIAKRAAVNNRQRFTGSDIATTLPAKPTSDKSTARKQRGPNVKYLPDTNESMTDIELQQWRLENRKRRNRQTASASIESKILYMKELEREILDYKRKVKDVHELISNVQQQPTTAPPTWLEPQQLVYPHRRSNGDTIMLPRFFVPTLSVPVP